MPEGHSVHRIARQFSRNFVGKALAVSSPQGRFARGALLIDGLVLVGARAVGKQLFLEFEGSLWLRIHLGLYGAWDFAGDITTDATIRSAGGRIGQTNQRGTVLDGGTVDAEARAFDDEQGEDSVRSIGAPRRARLRMSESERELSSAGAFPPEPVGAVRVRLLGDDVVADLRGPTACEVLDAGQVQAVLDRLGPDPINDAGAEAQEAFVAAVRRRRSPIGMLLMDQSVVSGIGNVYRAEMLFRARIDPHAKGIGLTVETVRGLWRDWAYLLRVGVATGQMMTMDGLEGEAYARAMASRDERHWVYKREGLPCRVCGTHIALEEMGARKLYWCPECQR